MMEEKENKYTRKDYLTAFRDEMNKALEENKDVGDIIDLRIESIDAHNRPIEMSFYDVERVNVNEFDRIEFMRADEMRVLSVDSNTVDKIVFRYNSKNKYSPVWISIIFIMRYDDGASCEERS